MNSDLKRVGLVFDSEGNANFVKTLQQVNASLRENYNQFKINQAEWNNSTTATEKLTRQQEYLTERYDIQSDKVKVLKMQLEELNSSEEKNEKAIAKKEKEIAQAEIQLKKYGVQLNDVNSKLASSVEKHKELVESLTTVGSKIENVGKKASILSGAVAAGLTASVKTAIDFESAFTGVEKTVDGTKEQLENLKQGIRDLAKEIPASTTEISAVAEAAGQLGIQTDNVLDFTKTMINMGNATNLSAEEAATTLARFANVTKMSQSDFDKLGSTIVALGNNFATTESEIATMGMNLGSAGSQIGMSQSEIMALATALSSVGLEAQAGGTAFSKLMINMQLAVETGNSDLKDFAKVAGMTAEEFATAFKEDATDALLKFIDGLSKSGEQGESAIKVLDEMGITETRLRDSILRATNASDIFNDAIKLGNKAWDENNALSNEANKRYGTLKSKLEIVKNKLLDNVITMGNKLMPVVEKMLDKVSKWTDNLSKLNDNQLETILKIGAMVVAAGPVITVFGKITSGVGGAIKVFSICSDALKVMHGTMTSTNTAVNSLSKVFSVLGSPTGIAVMGITALVGSISLIASKIESVTKDAEDDFEKMAEGAKEFVDGINSATSQLGNFGDNLFISAEEQQELSQNMKNAQDGITRIVNLASQERRNYTEQEIEKLNEYFQTIHEINQRELEIQQQKSQAIIQIYSQEIQSFNGSVEEYQTMAEQKIKTMQEQRDVELKLIEESSVEQLALLNQRYGDQATMQNEAYAQEYNRIIEQKEANIEQANQEFAAMYEIVTNGYAERIKADDIFYENRMSAKKNQEEESKRHAQRLDEIESNIWYNDADKKLYIRQENEKHRTELKKIYNQMYKDLDEESAKQLGVYLTMISNTELYGGTIDDKAKAIATGIIASYDSIPKKTKNIMKNAMEPMLEEMQNAEPRLFSKASNIANGILSKLKVAFDIHSPSRKTRQIFKNVMLGAEKGLEDEESSLYQQANDIAESVLENLNNDAESNKINSNYSSYCSTNNHFLIDYNQLYLCVLKALNNCKIALDEDGFIRFIDDRIREVM